MLCSHPAIFRFTADFVSRAEALEPPRRQWQCSHPAQLWATTNFVSYCGVLRTLKASVHYVAPGPTCGRPLIPPPPPLSCWGSCTG